MKTKIIYISGAEVFDMADVRAAFDTVRAALNLGGDTVLFGVPVDSDSAFANTDATTATDVTTDTTEPEPVLDTESVTDCEPEPDATPAPAITEPRRRGRPRAKKVIDEPAPDAEPAPAPKSDDDASRVVPILSVLAAKAETSDVVDEPTPEPATTTDTDTVEEVTISDVKLDTELVTPTDDNAETMRVTVGEMIADDAAPMADTEKTLEELLESMAPLDEHTDDADAMADDDDVSDVTTDAMVDATLEKLATEFAETEPEIAPIPKATIGGGKIGKLKNILPFKKARRDDSGLMNSLFDWAGVAANDEEFAIPGFFANATSNK